MWTPTTVSHGPGTLRNPTNTPSSSLVFFFFLMFVPRTPVRPWKPTHFPSTFYFRLSPTPQDSLRLYTGFRPLSVGVRGPVVLSSKNSSDIQRVSRCTENIIYWTKTVTSHTRRDYLHNDSNFGVVVGVSDVPGSD